MHLKSRITILITLIGLIAFAGISWADGIKDRMLSRLPAINDLKSRGIIGENNKGYLDFPAGKKEKQDLIEAENADRRIAYEILAAKTGATAEIVGQRRAIQIAEKAESGEWLQDAKGTWYRK